MSISSTYQPAVLSLITQKASYFIQLAKLRLSTLVVFSAVMAFLFEGLDVNWWSVIILSLGGSLVTASANAINQILEKDTDKLMSRTFHRPLPSGALSTLEATLFAGITGVAGIALLGYYFNPLSGLLGALSLLIYGFIYTPFKKVSSAAVFIGAIPGAMPLLIGSTAAAGQITLAGMFLFSVQFLWQMPHFWSIAWLLDEDYKRGGFHLLPGNSGKSRDAALQVIPYLLMLLAIIPLAYSTGIIGIHAMLIALLAGMYYLYFGLQLCIDLKDSSAKKLMFASFSYIPVVFIAFVVDKI